MNSNCFCSGPDPIPIYLIDVVNLPKSVLARDIGRFATIMGGICEMCFDPVDDRYDIS